MKTPTRRTFLTIAGTTLAGPLILKSGVLGQTTGAVNVGFIGVGGRGSSLLNTILKIPGVAVRAVCDINQERLQKAQKIVAEKGQPSPEGFSEWKRLLERKDLEAVVSALPCDLHARCYLDVIAAGKDLYGEKPMCIAVADCDTVVKAANASKQIVQIGFQRRADPRFIETIQQLHQGEIGDLVEGRVTWSNSWGPFFDWFGRRERSGDWMVEQAVHNWDIMNWVNRCRPARAMGLGKDNLFRELQPDRNVHDYYAGVVQYENGVIVNIIHSWIPPTKFGEEYTRLIGTKGGIDFNSGTFSYRPDQKRPDRVGHTATGQIDSTLLALEAFVNSVRTRQPSIATVEHGRDAVLTCLLMREAVYKQKAVTLKELLG